MNRRRKWLLGLLALIIGVVGTGALWWYWPENDGDHPGSVWFHERDLGSPYSTGIPYALALAVMDRYPDELGKTKAEFCDKFGVLNDPNKADGLPVGFVLRQDRRSGTPFLMTNCSLCHTAMIDGRRIDGLGNRNLRLNAINHAIMRIAEREDFTADVMVSLAKAAAQQYGLSWGFGSNFAIKTATNKLKEIAASDHADAWGGLSGVDAGPGRNTAIEFAKSISHVPVKSPYSSAKYPTVWTYRYRKTFGWDASVVGDMAFALAAVEFNKGMPADDILRFEPRWRRLKEYLDSLEPPPFPGNIDAASADRGQVLFEANCTTCHGTYGSGRSVVYNEHVVPLATIQTDSDRNKSVSPELIAVRKKGPFAKYVHVEDTEGYVPPLLSGIWCRGPYLHNASVPTLTDLLLPPDQRPVSFFVGGDTGYDLQTLGLAYDEEKTADGHRIGKRVSPKQYPFDTRSASNGNGGHNFGTTLSDSEKRDLLEYLKRL